MKLDKYLEFYLGLPTEYLPNLIEYQNVIENLTAQDISFYFPEFPALRVKFTFTGSDLRVVRYYTSDYYYRYYIPSMKWHLFAWGGDTKPFRIPELEALIVPLIDKYTQSSE